MSTKKDPESSGSPSYSAGHFSSYLLLLRRNRNYRRYWLSGCISQIGDWFNYIAIFVLLSRLTGSGQAVSWFLIAKYLPPAVLGPVAGVIADKFSRKKILVTCDLMRAVLVLGYLLIRDSDYVWLVYVLAFIQESIWTFYHPARQAAVPNLCSREELSIVNGLSGASWSVMLAFGAALGGFFTAHFGWQAAIIADCCSFLVSASIMLTVLIPHRAKRPTTDSADFSLARVTGWHDLQEGFSYIRARPKVLALLTVKSGWALSGGILVMLAVFGEQVFAQENGGGGGGAGGAERNPLFHARPGRGSRPRYRLASFRGRHFGHAQGHRRSFFSFLRCLPSLQSGTEYVAGRLLGLLGPFRGISAVGVQYNPAPPPG